MNSAHHSRSFLLVLGLALAVLTSAHAIVIDHTTADIWQIPESAITQAKATLHIAYGHTSHGSQLISGMGVSNGAELDQFMTNNGATPGTYLWNSGGSGGALDLRDTPFSGAQDLGNPDRYAWELATRNYLAQHPECNVIIWSWCGQAATTIPDIDIYLNLMEGLIVDFPAVNFVFMTGHLDGSGESGLLNLANEHIRQHCTAYDRILYDFADIESYDPDALVYYMPLLANDNCDYDSDGNGSRDRNWALDWQASHVEGVDWWPSGAAHSQHLNGNLKGYAAWWLWAVLAGWGQCIEAPSALAAEPYPMAGEIELNWTDNSSSPNEDSFIIQRRVGAGAWNDQYATVAADVTAFTDTSLPLGTYSYRVVAHRNDDGSGVPCNSGPSNVATAELVGPGVPNAPANLTSQLDGYDILLTWSDESSNEESFILERAIDGGGFGILAPLPANTESYEDPGLAPQHTYAYRVKAHNNYGDSDYSNEASQYVAEETFVVTLKQSVAGYAGCRDAYLDAANPTLNYGGDLYNNVQNNPKINFAIAFELPEEVMGMTILEAKIVFYCWTVSNWQAGQYLDLYRLTEDWVEGTGDGAYQSGCASWIVRSSDGGGEIPWSVPGGTHDPQLLAQSLIPNAAYYPEFDITALVQEWANDAGGNLGVLLKNDSAAITGIKASEYSEYGRPYMEINYTYPSTVPPATDLPRGWCLLPSFPNPASPTTALRFELAQDRDLDLSVFSLDGRRVATLVAGHVAAGSHEVTWRGVDDRGAALGAGMYFVRLKSGGAGQTSKILLAR
jgi:hypothetical protein